MSEPLVAGLRIGHAQDDHARTGCTVLLGPFRCVAEVRGLATGTRELHALSPLHLAPQAHALLLTGGSAFGLAAADGVMQWLAERGIGFDTGVAHVPIVPAAVIFDLAVGRADVRPDAAMGRAACDAAGTTAPSGRVGAGTGATVGKLLGPAGAMPGGIGIVTAGAVTAVAVVNALGDVRDGQGRIIAGARDAQRTFVDSAARLGEGPMGAPLAGANTTLVAVVTDAALDRNALQAVAGMAATGVARRITPVHTPFDGDVVFAASTAPQATFADPATILSLGALAASAVERAIELAVTEQ